MSAPTRERRPYVAFRPSQAGLAYIDKRAAEAGVTRSEMIRRMLAYAAQHMPGPTRPYQDGRRG